jgi:hypothetical protein
MSEPREELAQLINEHRAETTTTGHDHWTCSQCPEWISTGTGWPAREEIRHHIADLILTAGWQRPARVIKTTEELEALPDGTILLDQWRSTWFRPHAVVWRVLAYSRPEAPTRLVLPGTVLWTREEVTHA